VESPSSAKIPPLADTPSRHEAGVMEKWPVGLFEKEVGVATVGVLRKSCQTEIGYEAKIYK
jgi:hypothetical protein